MIAALEPIVRICGRPLSHFLDGNCTRYRLPNASVFPRPLTDLRTARLNQTLLMLYVDRITSCVRFDESSESLQLMDDPTLRLSFKEGKLENAARNCRMIGEVLALEGGDSLLSALVLSRIRPDLIDSRVLYEDLMSETIARNVSVVTAFVN